MRVSADALREVEMALERYAAEVRGAGLAYNTESTYIGYADKFVRWLRYDFEPSSRVRERLNPRSR